MSLTFIGFMSLIGAILITINKDKYRWLVSFLGFKNNSKLAIVFYYILGSALMLSGFINITYVNYFVLPAFVLILSLITILVTQLLESNETT